MNYNNPGALRKPGKMEFQRFGSMQEGINKQIWQLQQYHKRGLRTVRSVVETWAPRQSKGGDNTDAQVNNYIAFVARKMGISPDQPISQSAIPVLAGAIRQFETGGRSR